MENKFLITFAGPMGSSKTPIAYYFSYRLNIPNRRLTFSLLFLPVGG